MAIEPEISGMEHGDEPFDSASHVDAFASVLDGVLRQLRDAVEQANRQARREVQAAAEVVAAREVAAAELEASLEAERSSLQADRIALTKALATAGERQRALDAALADAAGQKDRAAAALAEALERSARLVEEAEARIRDDEARAQQRIETQLDEAQRRVEEMESQAAARLEAARIEAATMLERAVERGMGIMAEAESEAEQTRGALRDLAERIEDFLRWEADEGAEETTIDAPAEPTIDLRDDAVPSEATSTETVEGSADDDDERVVDAVRRAVRGWVGHHREADADAD